jgi:EamA domain-containing membrane protein RarD
LGFIIGVSFGLAFSFAIYYLLNKRIEKSQIPYKEILQKVPQGLVIFDKDINITTNSPPFF